MANEQQPTAAQPTIMTATIPATPAVAMTTTVPGAATLAREDDHTNLSTRLAYFAVGGAVGAIVALLFAPKPGRELRTDIADATRKGVDRTREGAQALGTRAGEYYEVSRERAAELYAAAQHKAGDVADTARERAHRKGEQLSAAIEAGKQAYAEEKRRTETFDRIENDPLHLGSVPGGSEPGKAT